MVEALVTAAIVTILALAGGTAFYTHAQVSKNVADRMQRVALQAELGAVIGDAASCTCQLSASKNTAFSSVLFINPMDSSPNPILLSTIRSGCDFLSSTNVVVKNDTQVGTSNLTVGTISIADIVAQSSSEYTANLRVTLNAAGKSMNDVVTPMRFIIDTTAGSPTHRYIAACMNLSVGLGPASCPSGFSLVGDPLRDGTHCIDTNDRGAATFTAAVSDCANLAIPGYSGFHLCGLRELNNVCSTAPGVLPSSGNSLIVGPWPDGGYLFWTGSSSNCNSLIHAGFNGNYRCCFK